MAKTQINIMGKEKAFILFFSAIMIIGIAIIFFQIGSAESITDKTQFIVFCIVLIVGIAILYKTIKSVSFKMAFKFRD